MSLGRAGFTGLMAGLMASGVATDPEDRGVLPSLSENHQDTDIKIFI